MSATVKRKTSTPVRPTKKAKHELKKPAKQPQKIEPENADDDDESELDAESSGSDSESASQSPDLASAASDESADEVSDDDLDKLDELDGFSDPNESSDAISIPSDSEDEGATSDLDGEPAARKPASSDARAKRQEQKRMQKERKLQKAHGQEIEQIKQLWEKLREKHGVSKGERTRLVVEVMKLVNGHWKDLVFRHDASRVVQTVFKYADKPLRQEITIDLKGTYTALAKSAYGKYLLVKMMHYGTPKVRAEIIDELHGSFRKLMGHKEGAYVLEDCYREFATAKQRRQIMREFYGSEFALFKNAGEDKTNLAEIIAENPEKKPFLLQNLNKVITQAVGKGSIGFEIVHAMMLEYIRNIDHSPKSMERETFIDLISDEFVEIVHTNPGSQVASLALAISTAKERKRLLKSLRQFPIKLAQDNYGTIVLMAAFLTVDDTKLTHKAFVELESDLAELMCDKFARRPFLMLLSSHENKKYFGVLQQRFNEVNSLKQEFSKKDDETRREELLANFGPAINRTIVEQFGTLAKDNLGMQFVSEVLMNEQAREPATVDTVVAAFEGDPAIVKTHPLNTSPLSGRVIKQLIRSIELVRSRIATFVAKYPVQWATGEGSFAVVSLLETLQGSARVPVRDALYKHRAEIKKSDAKGRDLLLELIKN